MGNLSEHIGAAMADLAGALGFPVDAPCGSDVAGAFAEAIRSEFGQDADLVLSRVNRVYLAGRGEDMLVACYVCDSLFASELAARSYSIGKLLSGISPGLPSRISVKVSRGEYLRYRQYRHLSRDCADGRSGGDIGCGGDRDMGDGSGSMPALSEDGARLVSLLANRIGDGYVRSSFERAARASLSG